MTNQLHSPQLEPFAADLELYITPSNACNLVCDFCTEDHLLCSQHRLSDTVLYEQLRPAYERAARIWVCGGEVTVMPGALQYMRFLAAEFPKANLAVVTNGTELTDEWLDFLVEHDVFVRISLNASNADTYSRATRMPNATAIYRQIRNNLERLLERKRQTGRFFPRPGITMVVTPETAFDIEAFVTIACQHQLRAWIYMGLGGRWIDDIDAIATDDPKYHACRNAYELRKFAKPYVPIHIEHLPRRLYDQIKREVCSTWVQAEMDRRYADVLSACHGSANEIEQRENERRRAAGKSELPLPFAQIAGKSVCARPWNYIAVSADATITPCCRRIMKLGNVNHTDIASIWRGPEAVALRSMMLQGYYDHCWGSCNFNLNPESSHCRFYRDTVRRLLHNTHQSQWFDGTSNTRERLEPHFFAMKLSDVLDLGKTRLAIYGAGQHTRRLLSVPMCHNFESIILIDDNPEMHGSNLCGYPIVSMAAAIATGCDGILISSDAHEATLARHARESVGNEIPVYLLYDRAEDASVRLLGCRP